MPFLVHRAVLVMQKSSLLCHCMAKAWVRVLPQALWPGSGVPPELGLQEGFLQHRIWKYDQVSREGDLQDCPAHQSVLHPLIASAW